MYLTKRTNNMLIDTHCHINLMVKKTFDTPFIEHDFYHAQKIIEDARQFGIKKIINVGTSIQESKNCIELSLRFPAVYAAIGIHPNDLSTEWKQDVQTLKMLLDTTKPGSIVAIGECGIDKHYPGYNLIQQQDAFRAQIELALTYNLPLVVHTRDAAEETLQCLQEFKDDNLRGTIHCFSEDLAFAQAVINLGFVLGIGGTITYPKNEYLRDVVRTVSLEKIILETDAPYLPIQSMRGKPNHPKHIANIAAYIAELRNIDIQTVTQTTTHTVEEIFKLEKP